jgi:serine/threonine protein kinase
MGGSSDLLQWARHDLERRLRAHEQCRAEEYFSTYPSLGSDPETVVALILVEVQTRRDLGQLLDFSECCARFPEHRALLQQRLAELPTPGPHTIVEAVTRTNADAGTASVGDFRAGEHQVYEKLGEGGMGVVYRAHDSALQRDVALKTIKSGALDGPEVERFFREASAAARLQHPHIVTIYSVGYYHGQPCYTMSRAESSLARQLDRSRRDIRDAVALMEKVARAVHAAHQEGIIHRDLKPGNILLSKDGEPLVADFGLAKIVDSMADASGTGKPVGTPAYMAPEQVRGDGKAVGVASDVWALGVILYEVLTGTRPFHGDNLELPRRIVEAAPRRLRSLRREVPGDLEAIVLHCLQRDPAGRYVTAEALADDLRFWREGRPIQARPPSRWRLLGRFLRHYALHLALAVSLAAVIALALLPRPSASPPPSVDNSEQEVERHLNDLAGGRSATLIGATGGPARPRWVTDPGAVLDSPARDGAFTFHSLTLTLLELLPDVPLASYRFRAEIRQHGGTPDSRVGLFLLRGPSQPPPGVEHVHAEFTFLESGNVSLRLRRYARPTARGSYNGTSTERIRTTPLPALAPGERPPYRLLVVEVRPNGIRAKLDGRTLGEWDRKQFERDQRSLFDFKALPPSLPEYPQGGLGLLIWRGAASFRHVVVEPLGNDD